MYWVAELISVIVVVLKIFSVYWTCSSKIFTTNCDTCITQTVNFQQNLAVGCKYLLKGEGVTSFVCVITYK